MQNTTCRARYARRANCGSPPTARQTRHLQPFESAAGHSGEERRWTKGWLVPRPELQSRFVRRGAGTSNYLDIAQVQSRAQFDLKEVANWPATHTWEQPLPCVNDKNFATNESNFHPDQAHPTPTSSLSPASPRVNRNVPPTTERTGPDSSLLTPPHPSLIYPKHPLSPLRSSSPFNARRIVIDLSIHLLSSPKPTSCPSLRSSTYRPVRYLRHPNRYCSIPLMDILTIWTWLGSPTTHPFSSTLIRVDMASYKDFSEKAFIVMELNDGEPGYHRLDQELPNCITVWDLHVAFTNQTQMVETALDWVSQINHACGVVKSRRATFRIIHVQKVYPTSLQRTLR